MIQGRCQRAHSLHGERNDATARSWYGLPRTRNCQRAHRLQSRHTALGETTTDHHSILLERTQRSSSKFASSLFRSFLNSFSSAFKVDCISLRLSVFFLALPPTGKRATKRRPASHNFSCSCSSHAARITILLRVHLHLLWKPRRRGEVRLLIRAVHTSHCSRLLTKC